MEPVDSIKRKSRSLDDLKLSSALSLKTFAHPARKRIASCLSPSTPSKRQNRYSAVDSNALTSLLKERYENVRCFRRNLNGPTKCIFFVQEKETMRVCFSPLVNVYLTLKQLCVKEVSHAQAEKEYQFAKKLSNPIPHPNVVEYHLLSDLNLLQSPLYLV
jgi:hypothetical protein